MKRLAHHTWLTVRGPILALLGLAAARHRIRNRATKEN